MAARNASRRGESAKSRGRPSLLNPERIRIQTRKQEAERRCCGGYASRREFEIPSSAVDDVGWTVGEATRPMQPGVL